ncbi:MAG: SpoIIE family protein phosphatase [Bacteroidales bacterium]|nr:SpoIIE family protein phosphatase [Bacteroidales bacterium]
MWPGNIYDPSERLIKEKEGDDYEYLADFVNPVADGLAREAAHLLRQAVLSQTPGKKSTSFKKAEKSFWQEYAFFVQEKLKSLNLYLRHYEGFCRTCIITESEITSMVKMDLDRFADKDKREVNREFFIEINYLIPAIAKEAGYEIIRNEELMGVNMTVIRKIARVIHSRYRHNLIGNGRSASDDGEINIPVFEELPEELKYSNIDNAAHIPTKLLSIGYKIRPVKKGFKPVVLHLNDEQVETMARVEHLRWSWEKRLHGWRQGIYKDVDKKTHPGLIPYNELEEAEKEKDRALVRLIPAILRDIEYEAFPASPGLITNLSYAIKPQSSIYKLLCETNELSNEIKSLASASPEISEKIKAVDEKIKVTIGEVQGSYNYARHIQKTFLPDDLYIRECFPDSFVLFKPKDIVSGDFYFFSNQGDLIIFALADCTGHGIPGALISTLGYGTLDQGVNVLKITEPSEILSHLFSRVHRFLRKELEETGVSDDMDIILCCLNARTKNMAFSGKGNCLFHITEGKITAVKCEKREQEQDDHHEYDFKTGSLQLKPGDAIYLSSDGFADQSGHGHKRYNRKRLGDFLLAIHSLPMPEQGDKLYEEIERWREGGNEDQTDDITVIGVRV